MADHSIMALVTPNPDASNGTGFDWVYSVNGGSFSTPSTSIHVPHGASPKIAVSVVAGGPSGDTCVFDLLKGPLTFTDENNNIISPPFWYQGLSPTGLSTITFTDDNTNNNNTEAKTYHILINMVYTSSGSITPKTSPDPTIVNDGTDHSPIAPSSQERTEPAVAAV